MPETGSEEPSEAESSVEGVVEAPFAEVAPTADAGTDPAAETVAPVVSDRLLGARDLALAALHEITPAATVGPAAGYLPEADGVISLRFENRLAGYPGWYWTVSVAQVDDDEPTVLEAELLPGSGALLAPEWVPWAERLADYRAHQIELAAEADLEAGSDDAADESADGAGSDGVDELDADDLDTDDLDADDVDDLDADEDDLAPRLHAGDLDGVDIDELDDSAEDEDPEDEGLEDEGLEDEDPDSEEE